MGSDPIFTFEWVDLAHLVTTGAQTFHGSCAWRNYLRVEKASGNRRSCDVLSAKRSVIASRRRGISVVRTRRSLASLGMTRCRRSNHHAALRASRACGDGADAPARFALRLEGGARRLGVVRTH